MEGGSKTNVAEVPEFAAADLRANGAIEDASDELFLIVLMLPREQGIEVCKLIRRDESFSGLPIAVLKSFRQELATLLTFGNAAGNKLRLPEAGTTVEGIKKLLSCIPAPEPVAIEIGDLLIDPLTYRVTRAGKPLALTRLEFQLLYYLAARPNRPFTRNQLVATVWGGSTSSKSRVVDVYVRRLRMKIEEDPQHPVHLKTLIGRGYQFV